MKYKVFIRGADTFSTGKKLFMGTILLSLFFYLAAILQGERLSLTAADSWKPLFSGQYHPP